VVSLYQVYQVYVLFYAILFNHWRSPLPKKKQKLTDKPDEEVIKKLFPKKVVDKAKEVAHEKDST